MDFVSEVDRKFYTNNLLTTEDWEPSIDLSDILGSEANLETVSANDLDDLPLDLASLNKDLFPASAFNDGIIQEFSDSSSDSGISGVMLPCDSTTADLLKQEPPSPRSPASSFSSETSDSQIYLTEDVKSESPPASPDLDLSQNGISKFYLPYNSQSSALPVSNVASHAAQAPTQINTILSSKVKIQPKPLEPVPQKVAIPKVGSGKQLVLTPEEFKRLTAQGVLKFQNPAQLSKVPASQTTQVVSPAVLQNPVLQVDNEIKALKRQQRMIKNRESASLSRKRKKEYLGQLEKELQEFTLQNQQLREENETLKLRLSVIQNENEELKKTISVSPSKRMCLMAVFLIFSLNVFQFSDYLVGDKVKVSHPLGGEIPAHKSRQLLSILKDEEEFSVGNFMPELSPADIKKFLKEYPELQGNSTSLLELITCPNYFNKTESVRLAEQLSGWMQSVRLEKEKKRPKKEKKAPERFGKRLSPVQAAVRGNSERLSKHTVRSDEYKYQVQVFDGVNSAKFWNSLPRRNDTFYVLSFSSDYFLVPATAHNKTMRPRMSLVMPAVALNDTMQPPPGNIGMMQIDCEVLNTQLIHVHKSSMPKPHWQHNGTFHEWNSP